MQHPSIGISTSAFLRRLIIQQGVIIQQGLAALLRGLRRRRRRLLHMKAAPATLLAALLCGLRRRRRRRLRDMTLQLAGNFQGKAAPLAALCCRPRRRRRRRRLQRVGKQGKVAHDVRRPALRGLQLL